jgi:hypothetical protein
MSIYIYNQVGCMSIIRREDSLRSGVDDAAGADMMWTRQTDEQTGADRLVVLQMDD